MATCSSSVTAALVCARSPARPAAAAMRLPAATGLGRAAPEARRASRPCVLVAAKKRNKPSMVERYGSDDVKPAADKGDDFAGWLDVGVKTADFASKATKPVVLANGDAIVVYKVGDSYYCSDANSTAYKYPMVDAKVVIDKDGEPVAEVPFDGTVYNLNTGDVITWCPKNTFFRKVVGSLKDKSAPVPLKVYPAKVKGDTVLCYL